MREHTRHFAGNVDKLQAQAVRTKCGFIGDLFKLGFDAFCFSQASATAEGARTEEYTGERDAEADHRQHNGAAEPWLAADIEGEAKLWPEANVLQHFDHDEQHRRGRHDHGAEEAKMQIERHDGEGEGENRPDIVIHEHISAHANDNESHKKRQGANEEDQAHDDACLPDVQKLAGGPANEREGKTNDDDVEKNGHEHQSSPRFLTDGTTLSPSPITKRSPPAQMR